VTILRRLRLPGQSPAARILALSAILLVLLLVGRWFYLGVRQAAQTAAYLRIGGATPEYERSSRLSDEHNWYMDWLQNEIARQRDPWSMKTAVRLTEVIAAPPLKDIRKIYPPGQRREHDGSSITVSDLAPYWRWSTTPLIVASRLGRREPVTPEAERMLEEALLGLLEHDYWKIREIGLVSVFDAELLTDQDVRATVERMAREDPNEFIRSAAQGWLFNHDERMARRRAGEEKPVWELREEYGLE